MKFKIRNIKLKSNWFDENGLVFKIGYDAFFLYLTLYRYYMTSQSDEDSLIVTSMTSLKKLTGYTMSKTYDLFKVLERYKLIKSDVTRWDRNVDVGMMHIELLNLPQITKDEHGVENPNSEDDFYIPINLELVQKYLDCGFTIREIVFSFVIRKYSNKTEGKCWVSIEKFAKVMNVGKSTITKMIRELNRNYLLSSYYRSNSQRGEEGIKLEHYVLNKMSEWDSFKKLHGENIEKNIKKWDKDSTKKKVKAKNKIASVTSEGSTGVIGRQNSVNNTPTPKAVVDQEELLPF